MAKKFAICIKASITKTLEIEAETLELAEEQAHQEFSVLNTKTDESYEQDTVSSEEIKNG